jgi:hypothetical protein
MLLIFEFVAVHKKLIPVLIPLLYEFSSFNTSGKASTQLQRSNKAAA